MTGLVSRLASCLPHHAHQRMQRSSRTRVLHSEPCQDHLRTPGHEFAAVARPTSVGAIEA